MHPTQPGVAAVGGRSIGPKIIKVLSTSQYESSTVIDNANFVERTLEGSDYRVWRVWDSEGKVGDSFSYSAQVWVSDLAFWDVEIPSSQGWRLATATRYGQIHIYNTTAGSKPIFVIPVSDHPLTNIRLNQEGSQLFFVDTQDIIGKVDPFLGILIEKYRISAGSAWYIDTFDSFIDMQEQNDNHVRDDNGMSNLNNNSNKSVIVTGGLDRYLRIYDYRKELQLKRKVYIGCTVTAVIVLDGNDSQERELQEHASALTRSRVCMDEEDNQKS